MPASTHWSIQETDSNEVNALVTALRINPLGARVLVRRGYTDPERARRFLNPSLDGLHDPFLFPAMREATERLLRAIKDDEKILLYGDYDVDGVTSVVILKKAIDLAGGQADFHVPHRLKEGYGLRSDVVEEAAASGVTLLICLDTGTRDGDVIKRAGELRIDVIIADHHLPERELPPALAVLNPILPTCPYPEKNLCGVGVAFKFAQALFHTLNWPADKIRRMSQSFLKLVAIGTVADVVSLTGENRILVAHGLAGLRSVRNRGLRALLDCSGFAEGDIPSSGQVAFRVAPRINAAGRMASARDVIELFLTEDEGLARELAEQLQALNQERQQAEADIAQSILEECSRIEVTDRQAALVFTGSGWHGGVVGIVASRMVERFHRPVFVLSENPDEGSARGSGRSIPGFHLLEAMESMADLFIKFGGHRQAAGLTLPLDRLQEFRNRFNEYATARLTPSDFRPRLTIDTCLDFRELTDAAVNEVLSMAPFGYGNPAPVFAAFKVNVASAPTLMKEKHLRFCLQQNGRSLACKAWNFAHRLEELTPGAQIDVAMSLEEDRYSLSRGYAGWGVVVKDVRRSSDPDH